MPNIMVGAVAEQSRLPLGGNLENFGHVICMIWLVSRRNSSTGNFDDHFDALEFVRLKLWSALLSLD